MDEVAQNPSSPVNEAQNEETHRDLNKASADDESNPLNKGPLDELGQLCGCQSFHMPASAVRNLVNVGHRS